MTAGRSVRALVAGVVLLLAGGGTALASAGTEAAAGRAATVDPVDDELSGTPGYCPTDEGVTVVVDFQELGGGIVVRCATGPVVPGFTGIDALQGTGFDPEGVRRYGLAFVCRIADRPTADQELPVDGNPHYKEACVNTPPVSAFWSYWYAPDRGTWTYSQESALSRDALPGGFEGWSFSLNHSEGSAPPPGIPPRRPAQPPPTTPPPTTPPATSAPPTTTPPTSAPPTSAPPTTARPTHRPPTHPPTRKPPTRTSPGRPGATTQAGTPSTNEGPPPSQHSSPRPTAVTSDDPLRSPSSAPKHTGADGPTDGAATSGPVLDPVAAGHNAAGERVSGELPREPTTQSGSALTPIVGIGLVALLAAGGGIAAWRRRAERE